MRVIQTNFGPVRVLSKEASAALRAMAKGRPQPISKQETPMSMTLEQRIEKGCQFGETLTATIHAYARVHGVSLAAAADAVCLSPAVSERVALEKREATLAKQDPADDANEALAAFTRLCDEHQKVHGTTKATAIDAVLQTRAGYEAWRRAKGATMKGYEPESDRRQALPAADPRLRGEGYQRELDRRPPRQLEVDDGADLLARLSAEHVRERKQKFGF